MLLEELPAGFHSLDFSFSNRNMGLKRETNSHRRPKHRAQAVGSHGCAHPSLARGARVLRARGQKGADRDR